jgi:hypothetical protein
MNKKYSDAQKLKAVFTTIIVRTENQGRIKEPDHSMVNISIILDYGTLEKP